MLCESWWFVDHCKQCNKKDVAVNAPKDAAIHAASNAVLLQNEKACNGMLLSDSATVINGEAVCPG